MFWLYLILSTQAIEGTIGLIYFLINVPSQFDFYFPVLDFEYETKKKIQMKLIEPVNNIYDKQVPLDRLWLGLEQGISLMEDNISCKSMYMYVFLYLEH